MIDLSYTTQESLFWLYPLVQAGLAILGGAVGSYFTNKANRDIAEENQAFQADENEKARQFQIEQTERQNAYNTPSAQMARYRSAGINPFIGTSSSTVSSTPMSTAAAPSLQSAPNMPVMRNPLEGLSSIGLGLGNLFNDTRSVDSEIANQQADTRNKIIQGATEIYKTGGLSGLRQYLDAFAPFLNGEELENSYTVRSLRADADLREAQAQQEQTNAVIVQKYGEEKAQQINWNLQQQAAESVTKCGLYNSMAKLYDSSVRVNDATVNRIGHEITELVARAYKEWSEGNYVQSLKLTEDERRNIFLSDLRVGLVDHSMSMLEHYSDYRETEGVRAFKESKAGKASATFGYVSENAMPTKMVDFVMGRASKAIGMSPKTSTPSIHNRVQEVYDSKGRRQYTYEINEYLPGSHRDNPYPWKPVRNP